MRRGQIFFISGTPGSGKSSVAKALLQHFPFGLHLPVDDLREMVVSGIAHPVPQWTEEASRQFNLARTAAVQTAKLYAQNRFSVVIDDVIGPSDVAQLEPNLQGFHVHKILLRPSLETTLKRNLERSNKDFDTALLENVIRSLYQSTQPGDFLNAGWWIVDNGEISLEQTVGQILSRIESNP